MSKRATKQETELRVAHAAELVDDRADMVYQGDGNEVWYYESNGSTFDTADQIADFSGSFTEGSLGLGDINGD